MIGDIAAALGVPLPYLCSVIGSLGVELSVAVFAAGAANGEFHPRYKRIPYIVFRLVFAIFFAGPLPLILGATTSAAAFYMGASAPLIYDKLARGLDPM